MAAFERGGAVLWMLQFTTLRHSPLDAINALIRGCLLEERLGETTFTYVPKSGAAQALKWTFHNGLGLVFVAVYQKTLSLLYVDELLTAVKNEFVTVYKPGQHEYKQFDDVFQRLLRDAETRAETSKRQPAMRSAVTAVSKQASDRYSRSSDVVWTPHRGDRRIPCETFGRVGSRSWHCRTATSRRVRPRRTLALPGRAASRVVTRTLTTTRLLQSGSRAPMAPQPTRAKLPLRGRMATRAARRWAV